MPDVWASVRDQDEATQERLADILEARGADPRQQAMRREFLAGIRLPRDAHVLDVGCGTGVSTRMLAGWPGVRTVHGIDPAPALLARARVLAAHLPKVTFAEGDGRSLSFDDSSLDIVNLDSTLSHIHQPERAIEEAFRVVRPGGQLAVFEGDYATVTVALGAHDPLQACVDAMVDSSVTDRWIVRRLTALVAACGFEDSSFRSFGYGEPGRGDYMLTIVDRGADILCSRGEIGERTAAGLKEEARPRVAAGQFYGHIAYAGLVARKP